MGFGLWSWVCTCVWGVMGQRLGSGFREWSWGLSSGVPGLNLRSGVGIQSMGSEAQDVGVGLWGLRSEACSPCS